MTTLADPACRSGYPFDQLRTELGDARYETLMRWMRGQTMSICEARSYSHETREYTPTGCGPHGPVVYKWDVDRWLARLPVID